MPKKDRGSMRKKRRDLKAVQNQNSLSAVLEETSIIEEIPSKEENILEDVVNEVNNIEDSIEKPSINETSEEISYEDRPLNFSDIDKKDLQRLQNIEIKRTKIKKSKKERGMSPEQIELKRTLAAVQTEKQQLTQKNKDLDELIDSKTKEFADRESIIKEKEDVLASKEKEREDSYNERMSTLERTFNDKNSELEKKFFNKNEMLELKFKNKEEKLENDTLNKSISLSNYFKYLEKMKIEEFEERETKTKEYETEIKKELENKVNQTNKELEDKITQTNLDIKNKKEELLNYINEEEDKLNQKKKETQEYEEYITKKVDEQIADKRQAFIDEMIYLDSEYRDEMDRREWEVSLREKEFERKSKEKEAQILKSVNEYSESVDKFNKEVEQFNIDKQKHLEEHHKLHIIKRKIKENLFATIILLVLLMSLVAIVAYSNEYKLFKGSFIASSVNKFINSKVNSADYEFELDTRNSVLTKFTTLDGLTVDVNTMKNRTFSENYDKVLISSGENTFAYERYYKDKYMVLKSPLFNQYVEFDDIEKEGLSYTEDEFNNAFFDVFKKMLANSSNKYTNVAKINVNGTTTLFDFINSTFLARGNYEYFYTITNNDVDFFKNTLNNVLATENYKNFVTEETLVSAKLQESNSLTSFETTVKGLIDNTVSSKNEINLKVSEDEKLSDIDITFNIEYKDATMASSVPMKVTIRINLSEIEEDSTLRNPKFEINPVKFENMITKK